MVVDAGANYYIKPSTVASFHKVRIYIGSTLIEEKLRTAMTVETPPSSSSGTSGYCIIKNSVAAKSAGYTNVLLQFFREDGTKFYEVTNWTSDGGSSVLGWNYVYTVDSAYEKAANALPHMTVKYYIKY